MSFYHRWYYTLVLFSRFGEMLNRRVEVENVLLNVAAGKRPMLTQGECRALAYKLAAPQRQGSAITEKGRCA